THGDEIVGARHSWPALWVLGDCQDDDMTRHRSVVPEDPVSCSIALGFDGGRKHLLASCALQALELVGVEFGMMRVYLQKAQSVADRAEPLGPFRVALQG